MASSEQPIPPPLPPLRSFSETEATSAVALAKLNQSKPFLSSIFSRKPKRRKTSYAESVHSVQSMPPPEIPEGNIMVNGSTSQDLAAFGTRSDPGSSDQYAWATVYEHQRGLTILNAPYYSSQSLLPWDPPAYMVPVPRGTNTEPHSMQSLGDFVLPDPAWHWVSRAWMVDMRSDGAVQYDGFEYNWRFRSKRWRPIVGALSFGGYVRRRRWVRLMVRIADEPITSSKPSVISSPIDRSPSSLSTDDIWQGDEDDWRRVADVIKHTIRDGSKLELWRSWLGVRVERDRRKQWTEDRDDDGSPFDAEAQDANHPVRREWLLPVLQEHGHSILHLFIFPDSRAQFLDLIFRAGLNDELAGTGMLEDLDFYSPAPSHTASPRTPVARASPHLITILDASEPITEEPTGYRVRATEKKRAAEALEASEIGRESTNPDAVAVGSRVV